MLLQVGHSEKIETNKTHNCTRLLLEDIIFDYLLFRKNVYLYNLHVEHSIISYSMNDALLNVYFEYIASYINFLIRLIVSVTVEKTQIALHHEEYCI